MAILYYYAMAQAVSGHHPAVSRGSGTVFPQLGTQYSRRFLHELITCRRRSGHAAPIGPGRLATSQPRLAEIINK